MTGEAVQMNNLHALPDYIPGSNNYFTKVKEDTNDDDAVSIASDTSSISEYMFMSLPKKPLITGRPASAVSRASRSKAPPLPDRNNKEQLMNYLDSFA